MMYRLPPVAGEWIDREREICFEFEGGQFTGYAGDSISTALAASGVMTLGRSFKYHRRRGIFSLADHDANNLFQVDGVPNVRGDVTPVREGMRVAAVNTVNGVERDRTRWLEWLAPFLPAGFYYKAFHGRRFPAWERRIRALSGLGRIEPGAPRLRTDKRYAFCDVLVIGGGPAGMSAALAAADAGAGVLLVDENARLGGSAWTLPAQKMTGLRERVAANVDIDVLTSTYAAGFYADRWVALVEPERMTKVRAGAVVVATGLLEQPAVFRHNDLPGVMLGTAARRLVHRYAIAPGRRIAVLTANREGHELARDLAGAGLGIAAVLDLRREPGEDAQITANLRTEQGVVPEEAVADHGGSLSALRTSHGPIDCDALLVSVGFAPAAQLLAQAGATFEYDVGIEQQVPVKLPPGVFAAGSVNGVLDGEARLLDGREAGLAAATFARGAPAGQGEAAARTVTRGSRAASHDFPVFAHPRGKDFVDLDEDLQVKDLAASIQEGYDSPELMKRFSTLGMGPSQGKHSNLHGARILLRERGADVGQLTLTTQRPFYHPVPLKHLAGAGFHLERQSALHRQHEELGAVWTTIGGWRRPEYYRRGESSRAECIGAEVRAVRRGAGLIDVSTLGKIEVFGPDAGAFLDRVYAGSFADLPVGRTRYGLLLDESGIVRDDGVIARLGDGHFYVTTTTGGAATVYRELLLWNARWRLNCVFVNGTGHRAAMNFAGPRSRELLQPLVDVDLSEEAFPPLGARGANLAGIPVRILRAAFVSSLGFEIHTRHSDAQRLWKTLLALDGVQPFGIEAQRVLRLEKGHAIVGQDTDGVTNPFEAGLGFAVRMNKPFFIGQRSLRIHQARGPRQALVGFELDDADAPIAEAHLLVHGGDIAGRVTSIARSPTLGRTIGFAMARPAVSRPGTPLSIRASDGRLFPARVVRTPFVEAA